MAIPGSRSRWSSSRLIFLTPAAIRVCRRELPHNWSHLFSLALCDCYFLSYNSKSLLCTHCVLGTGGYRDDWPHLSKNLKLIKLMKRSGGPKGPAAKLCTENSGRARTGRLGGPRGGPFPGTWGGRDGCLEEKHFR